MENTLMQQVADELSGRGYNAEVFQAYKNNIITQALVVRIDGFSAAPVIYPELLADMAVPGRTTPELADEVLHFTQSHLMDSHEQRLYTDKEYALSHARLAICNETWNQARLENTVHEHIEGTDLSVYPKIVGNEMSVTVTEPLLDNMGITGDEIMEHAKANSKQEYTVRGMNEVMEEMLGMPVPVTGPNSMVVISNRTSFNGASAICDKETLERARQMVGSESIYIIPSSIHELIAIPADDVLPQELAGMIREVNGAYVQEQEKLGDRPYVYDGQKLGIVKAETQNRQMAAGRGR